jgi:uncharacterized membrane protein
MFISSVLSLVASLVLAVDAFRLASNPNAIFSCDVNAVISCGKVAKTWQSQLLGFPNAYLGLISEPIVLTIAIAGIAGVVFPKWMMRAAQVMYAAGLALAWWLFAQSYFVIGAFCPWCLLITVATTSVFVSMTRVNIIEGNLPLSEKAQAAAERALRMWLDHFVMMVAFAVVALMISTRYLI